MIKLTYTYFFLFQGYFLLRKEKLNHHITLIVRDKLETTKPQYWKEDMNVLNLCVSLKGRAKQRSLICDYCGEQLPDHTYIDMLKHYEGVFNIDADINKQFIDLHIKKDYLSTLLPKSKLSQEVIDFFENGKSSKNIVAKKTNFKTKTLAKEIFYSPYESTLNKLYIESKSLELIHNEFNLLFNKQPTSQNSIKLSSQDKEAIYHAKEILSKRIHNPPTIAELSKSVAINELKLKTGFHRFFNETPYNISLEYRLQEAKKLLEKSELNINEIALEVGYKYVQSFSNAFIKRFGVRPKEVMKSRKYYY